MVIKHKNIFKTEAPWSDANQVMLKLDTGSWRTERPVLDKDKCNYCGLCALYCPPQCMKDMKDYYEADLAFCKGCGSAPRNAPSRPTP